MKASDQEIGKAYKAFSTYNHKAKKGRIESFDLARWLKVVQALNGKTNFQAKINGDSLARASARQPIAHKKTKAWTPKRRAKYHETILARQGGFKK